MLIKLYEKDTDTKKLDQIVSVLENGGIIIYPTDTVYSMACDILQRKAFEKMARIKGIKPEKANFSLICHDLSHISDYTKPFSTKLYKIMKRVLPGPFTFILNASNEVPRLFKSKKKTIGIRVPNNDIARNIVEHLGRPLVSTSIKSDDEIIEYITDPELVHEKFEKLVDIVIDGGFGDIEASTIVDCTGDDIDVVREGKGAVDDLW